MSKYPNLVAFEFSSEALLSFPINSEMPVTVRGHTRFGNPSVLIGIILAQENSLMQDAICGSRPMGLFTCKGFGGGG
jgi:hypothetical protein